MKNTKPKNFLIDEELCAQCGECVEICWNGCLVVGEDNFPKMPGREINDEWNMCWECHRCLAYCSTGALSICGKNANDSIPASEMASGQQLDALILNRRSCRNYKKENVDKNLLDHIFKIAGTLPTGSCNQLVEFTVIDDKEVMKRFRETFYQELFQQMDKGIFPHRFTLEDMEMIKGHYDRGNEIVFRGAPHIIFPHAPLNKGEWIVDTAIGLTYLELLMAAHGLGAIILSLIWAGLEITPKSKAMLGIPENHYLQVALAFGNPEIKPKRGVQRFDYLKVNRVGIN
jgi:nitroreductase/NAD-dependent dihydropyrimidine dehydrogenase PreA subunit